MRKIASTIHRFPVFLVFIVIVVIGIVYGLCASIVSMRQVRISNGQQKNTVGMVSTEYQGKVKILYAPFLAQVSFIQTTDPKMWPSNLLPTIQTTKSAMLAMRVSPEMRETHLSLVLLLDKWQRAGSGSVADQKNILVMTKKVVDANGWLR